MKRRHIFQLCLALLLCCPLFLQAQSVQTNYQYWIDNNKDEAIDRTVNGEDINLNIDVGSLAPGVHFFNIRAYETVGTKKRWGTLYRYLFCIPTAENESTPGNLQSYEYWLDNDYEHRVSAVASGAENVIQLNVDVSTLAPGIHFYNIRALDKDGIWGSTQRYVFSIPTTQQETTERLITGYTYAFDDNTPTSVVFDIPVAEYTLNKQIEVPSGQPPMVIDDDCGFIFDEDENTATLNRNVNVAFSLIFKDESGAMCSPVTTNFVVQDVLTEVVQPITYPGAATIDSHANGGFSVIRIDVEGTMTLKLQTTGACNLRLYSPYSQLIDSYDKAALTASVTRELEADTYYLVAFGNENEVTLTASVNDANMLKPKLTYEDDCVTITTTLPGADIYYTIDGTAPTTESTLYESPIPVDHNMTIMAIASWGGLIISDVVSMAFDVFTVEKPAISKDGNEITITTSTEGAIIYYTTDGTDPTVESTVYEEPFSITEDCTIKAIAIREGYHDSKVVSLAVEFLTNYAIFDSETGTLTFKYGVKPEGENVYPTIYDMAEYKQIYGAGFISPWHPIYKELKTVIFDESYSIVRPKSLYSWFIGALHLNEINGLEYLNTSEVENMSNLFGDCSSLTELDLSHFNTGNVTDMSGMFSGCSNLKTIIVGDQWSTESVTNGNKMFYDCTSLAGSAGTRYDSGNIDHTYAHIDGGTRNPGYFSKRIDVNGDNVLDAKDITDLIAFIAGKNPENVTVASADVNSDGVVNIADIVMISNMVARE